MIRDWQPGDSQQQMMLIGVSSKQSLLAAAVLLLFLGKMEGPPRYIFRSRQIITHKFEKGNSKFAGNPCKHWGCGHLWKVWKLWMDTRVIFWKPTDEGTDRGKISQKDFHIGREKNPQL